MTTLMPLSQEQLKNQLRIAAKQARLRLTEKERADKSRLICERMIRHIVQPILSGVKEANAESGPSEPLAESVKTGKPEKREDIFDLKSETVNSVSVKWGNDSVLLAYMPHQTEVDVTPLMEWCWSRGIDVALPKTEPDRRLSLWVVRRFDQLEPGRWGLREPGPAATPLQEWSRIGLALVPGLAFDRKRGRLGYGGGYYDRFFAAFRERTGEELFKLAPAFETQLVDEVPMDRHDFRVDGIMTECSYIC
jgi:5-formyltetrahydrofolate cyclo-ligase